MEKLPTHLREDYLRERGKLSAQDPLNRLPITVDEVLRSHYLISHHFESQQHHPAMYGVKSFDLLCSAVARQLVSFGGKTKWSEPIDQCATLFFGLVKNHAFHDGNKRTALLILVYNIWKLHRLVDVDKKQLEQLTLRVATDDMRSYPFFKKFASMGDPQIHAISHFLRRSTHKTDRRSYVLTFRELDAKLRNYGYCLEHPNRGFIDLCRIEKRLLKVSIKNIRQFSFPGWTREVAPSTLKEILKAAGLTPEERGIDSEVFYNESEPMYKLIQEYESLLKRLKDK
jgi:prophage maintenance system killer protein